MKSEKGMKRMTISDGPAKRRSWQVRLVRWICRFDGGRYDDAESLYADADADWRRRWGYLNMKIYG